MKQPVAQTRRRHTLEVHLTFQLRSIFIMNKFSKSFQAFWADEEGATAIEYGLLASLIAVAIIIPVTAVGGALEGVFETISAALA
jgi:pilus assembly protein Flp/PilA